MNIREGVDLAKMAVTSMLVCLVLGAIFTIWYLMSDKGNALVGSMEKSANSATSERLLDLQDQSIAADAINKDTIAQYYNNGTWVGTPTQEEKRYVTQLIQEQHDAHPLVTTTANVIDEFNEDSLLYIYVVDHFSSTSETTAGQNARLYTYNGVNFSNNYLNDQSGSDVYGANSFQTSNVYSSDVPTSSAVRDLLKYSEFRCHVHCIDVDYNGNTLMGVIIEIID